MVLAHKMADETVLHVETDDGFGSRVRAALVDETEVDVATCETIEAAVEHLRAEGVDCLVAASRLPDGTGTELLARAREIAPEVGCVLYGEEPPDTVDPTSMTQITEFVPADSPDAVERVQELVATTASERTQAAYPLPANERERLAVLDRHDVDAEQSVLQEIVDRAAEHLDVPQASINVITGDTQRFAVCHDEDWAPIPRQSSICTYTILRDEPMIVDDVETDPRFSVEGVIGELGMRSYVGAPIEPENEAPIATLCVYDEQPDRFGAADASYLQTLARDAAAVVARTGEEPEGEIER